MLHPVTLLQELFRPEDMLVGFHAADKWEAIDRLMEHLVASGRVPEDVSKPIHEAVLARERSMSTGMERGIAIPHAAVEGLPDVAACVGIVGDGEEGLNFESIDHEQLMRLVERRISDRRVLKLLRQWLGAGVMEDGQERTRLSGTPQGGVISPLLSNIYLHVLDEMWEDRYAHLGVLVRYADDFVVMCRTRAKCEEAERKVQRVLRRLGLTLHAEKTRRADLTWGREGFDFLGCHLHKRMSGTIWERDGRRVYFLQRWPSTRSMKRVRARIRDLTGSRRNGVKDVRVLIRDLNPVLRGWGNYFGTGNAAKKFVEIDSHVVWRLQRFEKRRRGRNLTAGQSERWTREYFEALGLHRLRGTVRYPERAFWEAA